MKKKNNFVGDVKIDIDSIDVFKLRKLVGNEDGSREFMHILNYLGSSVEEWESIFSIADEPGVVDSVSVYSEFATGIHVRHKFSFVSDSSFRRGWEFLISNGFIKDNFSCPKNGKMSDFHVGLFYVSDKFKDIYVQSQLDKGVKLVRKKSGNDYR